MSERAILSTSDALSAAVQRVNVSSLRFLMGFDAFVDEIAEMVDERQNLKQYERIETITDFGNRIIDAAGLSNSMEVVHKYRKSGGSAVNMGTALMSLGGRVSYVGCTGLPAIDPVFQDFADRSARHYNIADPGRTLALEFQDGKIMICHIEPLAEITWDRIVEQVGLETFAQLIGESALVGSINWTMTPHMNDIWQNMQRLLPEIQFSHEQPLFFVDPIDPQKRSNADIVAAMELLAGFAPYYRVVLSLNRKEATEVARAMELDIGVPLPEAPLEQITTALAERLGFYALVVHPVDRAGAVIDGDYVEHSGPYCRAPKLTTGAGDNFNAGMTLGLLLKLTPLQSLVLGMAASGHYVREAQSPDLSQISAFLKAWDKGAVE